MKRREYQLIRLEFVINLDSGAIMTVVAGHRHIFDNCQALIRQREVSTLTTAVYWS